MSKATVLVYNPNGYPAQRGGTYHRKVRAGRTACGRPRPESATNDYAAMTKGEAKALGKRPCQHCWQR